MASVILIRMAIRAVIFDMGGVLLRTADFAPREKLAARFGMSRADLEALVFGEEAGGRLQRGEISLEEHWHHVRSILNCPPEDFKAFYDAFYANDTIDTGLVDYIDTLRKRYKTALLSNASSNLRKLIIETWRIADAFDDIVISGEVGIAKPDPRIYTLAVNRLGVEAHEAIFVDDMSVNVDGARAAGLHGIQFHSPQQTRAEIDDLLGAGQES